jgi:MFS family permease
VAVILAAAIFAPAFLVERFGAAAVLLSLAAMCLGGANPPLDAARLDIMPPGLWGRAEAVRTFLRNGADAAAPVLFGVLSTSVFGGSTGLRDTFLLALLTLIAAGAVALLLARRTYPQDVATAAASSESR